MPSVAVESARMGDVIDLRRGAPEPAGPRAWPVPLIEREVELEVLGDAVGRLGHGAGGVVVLEAAAGLGKSALLDHAARQATDAGCLVRRAAPGPLERQFAHGVIRALLEAPLRDASGPERARLLSGGAGHAARWLLSGDLPDGDRPLVAQSMFWLCSALADERPVVLIVDDAHCADRDSLEVLCALARRVGDLPLLIVTAARGADPDAPSDLLSLLGAAPSAQALQPRPLTVGGAATLIRNAAPETPLDVCRRGHRVARGNPWLLCELAGQIAAHGAIAVDEHARWVPPVSASGRETVRRRLAALTPRDRAVAACLTVLAESAPVHVVAALAGIPVDGVAPACDALQGAGVLQPGGRRFAHPLVVAAVDGDLSRSERERLHREAARLLADSGAAIDIVAGHLMRCGPQSDSEVSDLLLLAATEASERGLPREVAASLERALLERAPDADRSRILARLATAAFDAGLPDARPRLREALRVARDPEGRVEVLTRMATLQVIEDGDDGLPALLADEAAARRGDGLGPAVGVAALDALMLLPGRQAERAARVAGLDADTADDPVLARATVAHRAWLATELGDRHADVSAALALDALAGDVLLHEAARRSAYHLGVRVLTLTDRHEEAGRAIDALREEAGRRGSSGLRAATGWYAGELALRTGHPVDAENHARVALRALGAQPTLLSRGAAQVLVGALTERGALPEARELLAEHGRGGPPDPAHQGIGLRHAGARLAIAEGDFERAYDEACEVGRLRLAQGRPNPTWTAWRSTAAVALAHLGRRDEAVVFADEELAFALAFGAPVAIVVALHARALAEHDDGARVQLCRRALEVAATTTAVLETARVRLELGSTLIRMGTRAAARDALRPALAAADEVGAAPLAERARRELVSSGLRPRRAAIEGVAALTPRQRQVCELAAAGKSNAAIARELFLTTKTVETHLSVSFRTLGVGARSELGARLDG